MPTKVEKDSVTGQETTGHEWDGIKELNTPLPRWWLYVMYACIVYAVVYWVLYPAIPLGSTYTKGLIGGTAREAVADKLTAAREAQAGFVDRIAAADLAAVPADPELLSFSVAGGRAAFADNCAPCHGLGGAGRPGGFPTLADDDWLWGGSLEEIHTSIQHGIRSTDEDARLSEMPAFGEILEPLQVEQVASYVLSLSGLPGESAEDAAAAKDGAPLFEENCAACHGEDGKGGRDFGAPNLADGLWLYGHSKEDVISQIRSPKHGVMPAWGGRLDPTTIKMLSVYVHTLGGGE